MEKWDYEKILEIQQEFYTEFKEKTEKLIKELIMKYQVKLRDFGGDLNSLDFVLALQDTFRNMGFDQTSFTDLEAFEVFRFILR